MPDFFLPVQPRTIQGKHVRNLRRKGVIPAVMYGHGMPTLSIEMNALAFQKIWHTAGESSLIDLAIGDQPPVKAIIHDVQYDPTTNAVAHVDFHQVKMTEKVHVDIPLRFEGEAPAVKEQGGILVKVLDAIAVECLPKDLAKDITVDVSGLKAFDDAIHVRDLSIPAGLTVKNSPDDMVANVEQPRSEAELAALEEKVEEDVSAVEVEQKEKAAEEETPAEEPASSTPHP